MEVARLTAALFMAATAVAAQDLSTYPTVRNPEKYSTDWRRFYEQANARTAETRARLPHHLDLAYGADPKQRLDLYLPPGLARRRPVFVFLHGGGFREGDRAHYGYVAEPFAAHGIATIVASYRLHPHRYPAQVEDTRRILDWIRRHVTRYGGDPERVFVGGHSAGAILSALVGVKTVWEDGLDLPPDFVKGIVPVSGPYDLRTAKGFVSDFVESAEERSAASPLLAVGRTPAAVVAFGSREGFYAEGSRAFVEALTKRGGEAHLVELDGMGHDATAMALGDPASRLFQAVLRMITS